MYIGGDFTFVGANEQYGATVNTVSGIPDLSQVNPNGAVYAAVPDGAGGWYIGGNFTQVGGQTRNRLARINADGTLHNWNPNANGLVNALAFSNGTVYAGGNFTTIGGSTRNRIASIDATSGATNNVLASTFVNSTVNTIQISGTTLYLGGDFTFIGREEPYGAAISSSTGAPDLSFVSPNGRVQVSIADGSGGWYIGGDFTQIGGQTRNRLARINADGTLNSWNPDADGAVSTLFLNSGVLYAGGSFTTIGGVGRNHVAAIDATTGLVTSWIPYQINGSVWTLQVSGTNVYLGGAFNYIGPDEPYGTVINTTTGVPTFTFANPNESVDAVVPDGSGGWYIGGSFTQVGGQTRKGIARINSDGTLNAWNPSTNGSVSALAINSGILYIGGVFSNFGGELRNNICAVDINTGNLTTWNPDVTIDLFGVRSIVISGSVVYIGGDFTQIGGITRNNVGAVDITTGLPTSWDPNADGYVNALVISGSTVYAGGQFYTIGGQSRNNIAALNNTTGAATT